MCNIWRLLRSLFCGRSSMLQEAMPDVVVHQEMPTRAPSGSGPQEALSAEAQATKILASAKVWKKGDRISMKELEESIARLGSEQVP